MILKVSQASRQSRLAGRPRQIRVDVQSKRSANIAPVERLASGLLGVGLAVTGLRRGGVAGWLAAALGGAMIAHGARRHCRLYDWMGITEEDASGASNPLTRSVHVKRTLTVNRPVEELYSFWRQQENMPKFMHQVESVVVQDEWHSHWQATMPVVGRTEWDAEIIDDRPNESIAWRTIDSTIFQHEGLVSFKPAYRNLGTEVTLEIVYRLPGGVVAEGVARAMGQSPSDFVSRNLHEFKQLMETGELATNEGPSCRG